MIEHSADPLDRGTELAQAWLDQAEKEARAKNLPEQAQDASGNWEHTECLDCGEDIPEGRLKLGKVRCVDCQSLLERKSRFYGSP